MPQDRGLILMAFAHHIEQSLRKVSLTRQFQAHLPKLMVQNIADQKCRNQLKLFLDCNLPLLSQSHLLAGPMQHGHNSNQTQSLVQFDWALRLIR